MTKDSNNPSPFSRGSIFVDYYNLIKPGIVYSNLLTTAAGFIFGSQGSIKILSLVATLLGVGLVIASACVFNNFIDRKIDIRMTRTRERALATGKITNTKALMMASLLAFFGFLILAFYTNWLTFWLGLLAIADYVLLYAVFKRRSIWGTQIGAIAGALPVVAGYVSATNHIGIAGLLLFLTLFFWQMPHFYAIAIFRLKDYRAAGLPVLPVKRSIAQTQKQIIIYITAFITVVLSLSILGYSGLTFGIVMAITSYAWLQFGVAGFNKKLASAWAKGMFRFSLIVILIYSLMLSLTKFLP